MDFRAGQIWKSEKHGSTITILWVEKDGSIDEDRISFKIESVDFDHTTEWRSVVLEQFINDHGFKLENTLGK